MTSCQPLRPHGHGVCLRCSGKRWYEYAKLLIFLHPTKRYAPFSLFERRRNTTISGFANL